MKKIAAFLLSLSLSMSVLAGPLQARCCDDPDSAPVYNIAEEPANPEEPKDPAELVDPRNPGNLIMPLDDLPGNDHGCH